MPRPKTRPRSPHLGADRLIFGAATTRRPRTVVGSSHGGQARLKDDSLLSAVEAWHARRSALLANEGVTTTLRPKSTDRSKNSVSVDLEATGRLGQAVVWDSGEAEIIHAELGQEPAIEIRAVASAAQVEDVLNERLGLITSH